MLLGVYLAIVRHLPYESIVRITDVGGEAWRNAYLLIPITELLAKTPKYQHPEVYEHYFRHLPAQGSAAWKAYRRGDHSVPLVAHVEPLRWVQDTEGNYIDLYSLPIRELAGIPSQLPGTLSVGGSEVRKFIGNTIQHISVLNEKIDGSKFRGSEHTRWGNLFEPVIKGYMSLGLRQRVWEYGSLPGMRDELGRTFQTYSPDGMCTCRIAHLDPFLSRYAPGHATSEESGWVNYRYIRDELLAASTEWISVLFEFKCPTVRIPDGEIPDDYVYQPQTGLHTMPGVDLGLFVNSSFRACRTEQFGLSPGYSNPTINKRGEDVPFHNKDPWSQTDSQPLAAGFIGLHEPLPTTDNSGSVYLRTTHYNQQSWEEFDRRCGVDASTNLWNSLVLGWSLRPKIENRDHALRVMYSQFAHPMSEGVTAYLPEEGSPTVSELLRRGWLSEGQLLTELYNDACRQLVTPDTEISRAEVEAWLVARTLTPEHPYGIDYGSSNSSELFGMLSKYDGCREQPDGLKAYYPEGYYTQRIPSDGGGVFAPRTECWVDWNLSKEPARAQAWLSREVGRFLDWCREHQRRPVGILPWKLLRMDVLPVEITITRDALRQEIEPKIQAGNERKAGRALPAAETPPVYVQVDPYLELAMGMISELPPGYPPEA
jgi:hypothetical protein